MTILLGLLTVAFAGGCAALLALKTKAEADAATQRDAATTAASEAAQWKAVSDSSPTMIMTCTTDLIIDYVNEASVKALRPIEHVLPVKADDLVGTNIDVFHKHPEHQRRMLADPSNLPHQATIEIGGEELDLLISARYDVSGTYVGPMLTWERVTERNRLRREAFLQQRMIEESPANLLMCDLDFNITYANPASITTLSRLREFLPIDPNDLVGSSIDVFHKNPSHQRRMLADPTNLPHQAVIQLGEENLDLLISAITDEQDDYAAIMLTWSVATDAVKEERERTEKMAGILEGLSAESAVVAASSEQLMAMAGEMSRNAESATQETDAMSIQADEVTQRVAALTEAIREVQTGVSQIADSTTTATEVALRAADQASLTTKLVAELSESSDEIGEVVQTIDSIADQTNLLALNAAIEAARAGESGRGFAVVAGEVKALAEETSRSTVAISKRITDIQSRTGSAASAIQEITTIVADIVERQESIAAIVTEQDASATVMAEDASAVNDQVAAMHLSIGEVNTAASITAESVREAESSASQLGEAAERLASLVVTDAFG